MFRRMDDDHSKQLGYEEFRKGVHDTGLELGEEECRSVLSSDWLKVTILDSHWLLVTILSCDWCRTMFSMFDKDGSGQVSIDEFLYSVRVSYILSPASVPELTMPMLQPPMNRSRQGVVMEAYQKLDKSGDGVITIEVRCIA